MKMHRIGVIGAGLMGSGIAQTTATFGYPTVCYDVSAEALSRARDNVVSGKYGLLRAAERGKISAEQVEAARDRLRFTDAFEEAADADIVIEAVYEDLALKIRTFTELDRKAPASAVLASNTSGLPIAAMAAATTRPSQVIGWHWASPAPVRPLAEIATTPETSPEAVELITDVAATCKKNPIVVKENPMVWGFVVNRIYTAMMREAQRVVAEGLAEPAQVDQLLIDCYAWPTGPMAIAGMIRNGWA
jgi:3-hydroxyacyl-CoA dehydrogenase